MATSYLHTHTVGPVQCAEPPRPQVFRNDDLRHLPVVDEEGRVPAAARVGQLFVALSVEPEPPILELGGLLCKVAIWAEK